MLSRLNRFHGHTSVRRVYRTGSSARLPIGSIHVARHERIRKTKVAVVVSRKVDKSAVRRNRIRRRVYEICRSLLPALREPAEIVLTIQQTEVAEMEHEKLEQVIKDLLKKTKLLP